MRSYRERSRRGLEDSGVCRLFPGETLFVRFHGSCFPDGGGVVESGRDYEHNHDQIEYSVALRVDMSLPVCSTTTILSTTISNYCLSVIYTDDGSMSSPFGFNVCPLEWVHGHLVGQYSINRTPVRFNQSIWCPRPSLIRSV